MLIYKITNKINGKVYIGQTSQSLEKRHGLLRSCLHKVSIGTRKQYKGWTKFSTNPNLNNRSLEE